MPIINLIEGPTDEHKERPIHEVADACHRAIDAPRETVKIIIRA
ncbi:hypothetical protein PS647_02474 [Pseudomonas fluorescens]|jgi:4-oxalocrotonate tautomerase|nr:tautomerase family protein [Pseudomonas fluorescens]VVM84090.1 hypothetical protein PS647_02474 [Pseudomonas fluorescens]